MASPAEQEMGPPFELAGVDIESLVPAELRDCEVAEFMRRLPEFDARMAEASR